MSDKPISVGDLVMVVRASSCCGHTQGMGLAFCVEYLQGGPNTCHACGDHQQHSMDAWFSGAKISFPVYRLKRIDPDALKDDIPTREELTA